MAYDISIMNTRSLELNDSRIENILKLLMEIASGNYTYKIDQSKHNDGLDGIIAALNMLAEEFSAQQTGLEIIKNKYQDLYENAPDMFISVDAKTATILQCNQTVSRNLGYNKDEIIGKPIFYVYHPDCVEDVKKAFATFLKTGVVRNYELQLKRKDGTKIDVTLNATAVRDEQGNILCTRSIWRDITIYKKTQIALNAIVQHYHTLSETSPVGIYHTDATGNMVFINKRVSEISKLSGEQAMGSGWQEALHTEDKARVMEEWFYAIKNNLPFQSKFRFLDPDRNITHVWSQAVPEKDSQGNTTGYIGTVTDITKHIETEKRLHQYVNRAELAKYSRISTVGEMVSGIAHELNQPLGAIVHYIGGCLTRLRDINPPKEIIIAMERAMIQAERAGNLIHGLKESIKKGTLQKTKTDINKNIKQIIKLIDFDSFDYTIDLKINLDEKIPHIFVDQIQIEQAIYNIIQNAIDAMMESYTNQATLSITTKLAENDFILITICDTGSGIPTDIINNIFTTFFTTKQQGIGIGLSISKTAIEAHSGHIEVTSEQDSGAKFKIFLPLTKE